MTEPDGPIYRIQEHWGTCRLCGEHDDLRSGVCFGCALRAEEGLPPLLSEKVAEEGQA